MIILDNIGHCIADFLKNEHHLHQIGVDPSLDKIVSINESLFFLHNDSGR